MSTWILTGMSGAGKATALAALERAGARCIDNLPPHLVTQLTPVDGATTVAVVDARHGAPPAVTPDGVDVLFLDARDDVLVRRIGESTRPHPFDERGRGAGAVRAERAALAPLRAQASVVVDTSELTPDALQQRVREIVLSGGGATTATLHITVSSFGFKHGVQVEADWVVDVRMLRNPYWEKGLRPLTGLDEPVRDFVLAQPEAAELVRRLADLLLWSAAQYRRHGKRYLHVALGCTGGRHRSVVLAEALAAALRDGGESVAVRHRDVERPDPRE